MAQGSELNVMITGQAGQGIESIGEALARLFKDSGYYIYANRDYMSRIRGGNNFVQLRIADHPVHSPREECDLIFCLDGESVELRLPQLAAGGVMIADLKKFKLSQAGNRFFDLPLYEIATRIGGSALYANTAGLGVLAAITLRPFSLVESVLKDTFKGKGDEIMNRNSGVALAAYDFAMDNKDRFAHIKFREHPEVPGEKMLFMTGHDAVTLGAIRAGCKFYSGYPMTPTTGILETMAKYAPQYGMVVEQAEDEIAAINMVVGASYAGVRSMTATSGGGFCLMTEGLALAAMTETPVVIVVGQRPGPATGFPTRTSQDNLNFVLHAGHGEFARAVFAPGTIEQGYYLTVKAFNIAEKYQVPVIILTDQLYADSYMNIRKFDTGLVPVHRYVMPRSTGMEDYRRYEFTGQGISPRAVPSWIDGVVYADSDEHTEEGHITEDADIRRRMVEKRLYRKFELLSQSLETAHAENLDDCRTVLVGYGSTFGVMKDACAADSSLGFVHLPQVWPFPADQLCRLLKGKRDILTVENDADAQLAQLMFRETGIEVESSILKYDGRPFSLDEVVEAAARSQGSRQRRVCGLVPVPQPAAKEESEQRNEPHGFPL